MKKLLIVQPYLAKYRLPFYEALLPRLESEGVLCTVAAPPPGGQQAARQDSVASRPWSTTTQGRSWRTPVGTVTWYGSLRMIRRFDAVVAPAAGSCIDSHAALMSNVRTGLWGHIGNYVNRPARLDGWIEGWQLRQADHVFAYTASGRDEAIARGVPTENVTVLNNTIDITQLYAEIRRIPRETLDQYSAENNLHGRSFTIAYIGGLDESKNIKLLAEAMDELWQLDKRYKLLVAGRGSMEHALREGENRGQIRLLGYADDAQKALILRSSGALAMPGRVGLVALDAIVGGIPVVTTSQALHGPEVEYLKLGDSLFETSNESKAYADLLRNVLTVCKNPTQRLPPSMSDMVDSFASGVHQLLR